MLCLLFTAQVALAAGKRKATTRPKKAAAVATAPMASPAPPSWSPEELERRRTVREFVVVGVYRPVEMAGRVVTVPREIYLQAARGADGVLNDMVGQTLDVRRRVAVPAAVAAPVALAPRDEAAKPTPKAAPSAPASAPASAALPASTPPASTPAAVAPASGPSGAVARLKALKKAQEQAKAATSAPAPSTPSAPAPSTPSAPAPAAAKPPPSPPSASPAETEGLGASSAEIVRPRPAPLPSLSMDVLVGRVQVVEIRGDVVVARVALDGLAPSPGAAGFVPAEVPAVMAGDVARFVKDPPPPEAPPPSPPPQALSKAEQARLLAERKKAQSENWRRKNPRGKYERKSMKWKL